MSQDLVADALNRIMNAKRAKRESLIITRFSKLLINVLDIMKEYSYVDYELSEKELKIILKEVNSCKAIKPRYTVNTDTLEKYIRRFLPARNFGFVIVSTSKGLMTHYEAKEKNVGGSLIAFVY